MKTLLLLATLLISIITVTAQDIFKPPVDLPNIKAVPASGNIAVDGRLDESDWATAEAISNFIQIEPHQGQPSLNPSFVKVLFSKSHLYIGVFCSDSLGKGAIRVPDMMRDFNWRAHDTFAIAIDGFNDKRNSMTFVTNPYGTQKDYLSFDDVFFDSDWNGLWRVRTSITDHGWYAEFAIPWKTLRYAQPEESENLWNINFLRLRRESNEISAWSAYPRSFGFNRMEYAGTLQGLTPPPPGTNIQFNPYLLISTNSVKKDGADRVTTNDVKAGGEIKWSVNTHTTVDLTLNTDFAQADADVQVNNVSRFSVLFPEKRQFFLENASLFSPSLLSGKTGGNMQFLPFFSRRIGLSAEGRALPVDAGLRVVNRGAKQSAGIMGLRQGSLDTLPSADIFVGRYTRNFGNKFRLGTIATYTSTGHDQTNLLAGVDGFVRMDAAQSLNFLVSGSHSTATNENGLGAYGQYFYTSNLFTAWWTETIISENFQPDLGFVSRTDVIGTTPGVTANIRGKRLPFNGIIRSYQPGVSANLFHQASSGKLTEQDIKLTPFYIEMQDGGYYGFSASMITQDLLTDFTPLGIFIPKGRYEYNRYSFVAGSDPSRKWSYTLQHDFGKYYDGSLRTTDFMVSIIPMPHIALKGGVNWNQFSSVGSEEGKKEVTLYTFQGRLALNPRVQLIGLYQRTQSGLESYNARFAWEFRPLSYIYLVVNSRETPTNELTAREQQGIVKVSFLKQF
ncbi:MAG: DUF5916 domain-containing protein [Cyclobacteriaceae bacterium]